MRAICCKFCFFLLGILCVCKAGASERYKTQKESYFFVYPQIYSKVNEPYGFDIYVIPAGTEVELLSKLSTDHGWFVRAELADGSLGYFPVFAFSDATLTVSPTGVTLSVDGEDVPAGKYSVKTTSPWKYVKDSNERYYKMLCAVPNSAVTLVGAKGKEYKLAMGQQYNEVRYTKKKKRYDAQGVNRIHEVFRFGSFQQVFDKLPVAWCPKMKFNKFFNADDNDINAFVGCSRSYLETIFGEATAYIGPALSNIPGYTYALYSEVGWRSFRGKDGGIVVYYDQNLCARFLAAKPINYASEEDAIPLYFPKKPIAEANISLMPHFQARAVSYVPMKADWTVDKEVVTRPQFSDRFCIFFRWFFERSLGLSNPFAVWGVMLLLELLFGGFVWAWVRHIFNYGSNGWAKARTIILMIPITVLFIVYLWRYPIIFTIFSSAFLIEAAFMPMMLLEKEIDYKRCPKCHQFCEPSILNTKSGKFFGDNCSKTGRREQIGFFGSSGEEGAYHDISYYKCETLMRVTQDMHYEVSCPCCGHQWGQDKKESRPSIPGPILIEQVNDVRDATVTTTTTTTKTFDEFGRKLDEKEDVEHKTKYDKSHFVASHYDNDYYFPFFKAYINGDRNAIARYYKERWGTITWRDLY